MVRVRGVCDVADSERVHKPVVDPGDTEAMLRGLLDNMNDGVAVYEVVGDGEDFVFCGFNAAGESIEHVDARDVIGRPLREVFPGVERFGLLDALRRVWRSGVPEQIPINLYQDDRIVGWRTNRIFRLPSGRVVTVYDDLTPQKRAEAALEAEQVRLRAVIDSMPDLIFVKDREGRMALCNAAALRYTGAASVDALIGKTVFDIYPPDVAAEFGALEQRVVETGEPVLDVIQRGAGGERSPLWALTSVAPLRDADGGVVGLVGVTRDITQLKQAEDALRESEDMLRQVVENVPCGVFIKDGDGVYTLVNRTHADFYGLTPEEFVGLSDGDLAARGLIASDQIERRRASDAKALRTGRQVTSRITQFRRPDGEMSWTHVTRVPFGVSDAPDRILGIAVDVTALKEAEDQLVQQERLAAIGHLAGGFAHDFNNILTTILLYIDTLKRDESLSEAARRSVGTIGDEAHSAAALVQQILDFGRRNLLRVDRIDVGALVARESEAWRRTLPRSIALHTKLPREPMDVIADPRRLGQALMNLVTNARDAMPDGGALHVDVSRLTLGPYDAPPAPDMPAGDWVRVAVSDTGTGMSGEMLRHVFEPFWSTKPVGQGTGLGLAQVHGIVRQHDGHISVETALGQGTTVAIYLRPAPQQAAPQVQRLSDACTEPAGTPLILVVQDDPAMRGALDGLLTDRGYRVIAVGDAGEALAAFEATGSVDLLITDLQLPAMSGAELVHTLRERSSCIRVLALTGLSVEGASEQLPDDEFTEIVRKPFDLDALYAAVERLLA